MPSRWRQDPEVGHVPTGMDVSVVIPARNETAALPECLLRLRDQSLRDMEVIVVDSASTDGTGDLARCFGARVVRVEAPGVGLARQAGFDAATRSIIVSTDADTLPDPDWVEQLVAPLQNPSTVCTYGTLRLDGRGPLSALNSALFRAFQRVNSWVGRPICCGPNFAVRKDAFRAVGGFADGEQFPNDAEDIRLALKLRSVGDIVFLPRVSMSVSPRSLAGGKALRYILHHAGVYFRVCWFRRAR